MYALHSDDFDAVLSHGSFTLVHPCPHRSLSYIHVVLLYDSLSFTRAFCKIVLMELADGARFYQCRQDVR